jgi:2-polyprenyl-3-methyl-5-hydroxy-6-metoxy-1,4-benzoquinol methylase
MVDIEKVSCTLCDSSEFIHAETIYWKGSELKYGICSKCGLKYMVQRPNQSWYTDFYKEKFWQNSRLKRSKSSFSFKGKVTNQKPQLFPTDSRSVLLWREDEAPSDNHITPKMDAALTERRGRSINRQGKRAQRIWRIISSVTNLTPSSVVLEIGAGWGEGLRLLKNKTGCNVLAVEPSESAGERIEGLGILRIARSVEELSSVQKLKHNIDLVIMSHVLENTNDPMHQLSIVRKLLKSSGKLYIDTPNLFYNNCINPYHPYIFSPDTLKEILSIAGFKILHSEHENHLTKMPWFIRPEKNWDVEPYERQIYLAIIAVVGPKMMNHSMLSIGAETIRMQRRGLKILRRSMRYSRLFRKIGSIIPKPIRYHVFIRTFRNK